MQKQFLVLKGPKQHISSIFHLLTKTNRNKETQSKTLEERKKKRNEEMLATFSGRFYILYGTCY